MKSQLETKTAKRGTVESFLLVLLSSFAGGIFTMLWVIQHSDIEWFQTFLRGLFK